MAMTKKEEEFCDFILDKRRNGYNITQDESIYIVLAVNEEKNMAEFMQYMDEHPNADFEELDKVIDDLVKYKKS